MRKELVIMRKTFYIFIAVLALLISTSAFGEEAGITTEYVTPTNPYGVSGPSGGTSTDNALPRWDGVDGLTLKDSTIIVDDSGNTSGVGTFACGNITSTGSTFKHMAAAGDYWTGYLREGEPVIFTHKSTGASGFKFVTQNKTSGYGILLEEVLSPMDGDDTYLGFHVDIGNAVHTGANNTITAFKIDGVSAGGTATGTAIDVGDGWDYILTWNYGFIDSLGSVQLGGDGQTGSLKLHSEQGATDYWAKIYPNPAMTSNASFYTPVDEPAGTYLLTMNSGGVMGFDTSDYITATESISFTYAPGAGTSGSAISLSPSLNAMNGSDTVNILNIAPTNANHTGASNVLNGIYIAPITGDADATENGINIDTGYDKSINAAGDIVSAGAVTGASYIASGSMVVHNTRGIYHTSQSNNQVYPVTNGTITYLSGQTNSSTNIAHTMNTSNSLTGSTKLLSLQNATAEKFAIMNGGAIVLGTQSVTIADSGDGNPATASIELVSSYVEVTCSDTDGCSVTILEAVSVATQQAEIVNISANVVNLADQAGVLEIAGGAWTGGQYDVIGLRRLSTGIWAQRYASDN